MLVTDYARERKDIPREMKRYLLYEYQSTLLGKYFLKDFNNYLRIIFEQIC